MPKAGWKKGADGKFHPAGSDSDKSQSASPLWNATFIPFGDRLNFLSPEVQHLNTGNLRILPPKGDKERQRSV